MRKIIGEYTGMGPLLEYKTVWHLLPIEEKIFQIRHWGMVAHLAWNACVNCRRIADIVTRFII